MQEPTYTPDAARAAGKPHPSVTGILAYFKYDHPPERLQGISRPFCELAEQVADRAPHNPETTVALRKLLEAKDAAVRAAL